MDGSGSFLDVSDANFSQEILKSEIPALVDFWAKRCDACQTMAPVVEELAREYGGRIKVARLRVEENPQTPRQYGVRGMPTLILFKNGRVFDQAVGIIPKDRLRQMCEQSLGEQLSDPPSWSHSA